MTTLAAAVDDNDELWTLDTLPTPEAPYVEVESELVEVRSRFPSQTYTLTGETLPPRIRVRRGVAGTTKASHIQGSTLTPNYGLGSEAGAGGVTVDNQSDPPAEVTTLIAPGADVSTPGQADLSGAVSILQTTVTLTDAQIKALHTTPIELVPAAGADTLLKLIDSQWVFDTAAGVYTNVDALNFTLIAYLNAGNWLASSVNFTEDYQGFLSTPDIALIAAGPMQQIDVASLEAFWLGTPADYINKPLVLAMNNGASGNLTGGNVANSLKVIVWYGVMDLS